MTPFVFSYLSHGLYSVTDIICNWNTLGGAATLKFQAYYDYTHTALNIIIATSNHLTTTYLVYTSTRAWQFAVYFNGECI